VKTADAASTAVDSRFPEETKMTTVANGTFGRWILGAIVLAAGGLASAEDSQKVDLKVGDVAPVFAGTDDKSLPWKSSDRVGKKYVVIYFYPADFTPGCMRQAQNFRDAMNKLAEQGVEVVGVSGDSVSTHQLFKKDQKLNFTLLADEDGSLAKRFGVPVGKGGVVKVKDADGKPVTLKRGVTASRWTFVIGKDGKIAYKNPLVNPTQDAKQVADLIAQLEKK
jgi:peroxiredoxin Q/BCP